MASEIGGTPIDPKRLERMKRAFERSGGVIDQSESAQAYLRAREAEAVTFDAKTMVLPEQPSTSAVFEEFIHTAQHRTGRYAAAVAEHGNAEAVTRMEIEAAKKLIRNAKAWGIPEAETAQTRARLLRLEGE